jgi:hypothetical protein
VCVQVAPEPLTAVSSDIWTVERCHAISIFWAYKKVTVAGPCPVTNDRPCLVVSAAVERR